MGSETGTVRLDLAAHPAQVIVWMLLLALVSFRITLPPYVKVSMVRIDLGPPWSWPGGAPVWVFLVWIAAIFLAIAGAWIFEGACRRFCRALRFSDGTAADFSGRGDQILGWWTIWILAGREWGLTGGDAVALEVITYFLGLWATLHVLRWFAAHVELSNGRRFEFRGAYAELLGWHILIGLSIFTVIGWAWGLAGMFRWAARSTRAKGAVLAFHGRGLDILWRTVAAVLFCAPIVTIPWAWIWYTRWLARGVTVELT